MEWLDLAKYEVVLYPPNSLAEYVGQGEFAADLSNYTREISLLCNTVAMPGHDLQTQTVQYGSATSKRNGYITWI